ncbi:Gustatory receptor for sugar taste 64a [Orchesella cincta]|uniref:Gustatory receptor for sugar taste 64a n=1 Tax=Orchesella cincta TaxID=48709 RepID=A0A1D2ML84_ORCCI|nr:Gustatory receptor for sugar taste 64a [Orchesella cincta]
MDLNKIFEEWRKLPVDVPDVGLKKFSILVPGFVMTSAILENVCFHFRMFPVFDPPPNINNLTWGAFQVYYDRHHTNWSLLVPFHPIIGTLLILANKFALYAWNYADLLVVVMCRALAFRFAALYRQVEIGKVSWNTLWQRYAQLMEILSLLEAFLSPTVFLCFYINLYATCMQLHSWMNPESNQYILHTVYLLWSFVHLLVRVFLVMYHAASVSNHAEHYGTVVQNCPEQFYTKELARQIRYPSSVDRQGMGISGLGCFVITRPFILKFASVAFFFEVFLITSERVQC